MWETKCVQRGSLNEGGLNNNQKGDLKKVLESLVPWADWLGATRYPAHYMSQQRTTFLAGIIGLC